MDDGHKFAYIISRTNNKIKDQFRFFIFNFNNLTVIRPASAEVLLIFNAFLKILIVKIPFNELLLRFDKKNSRIISLNFNDILNISNKTIKLKN